VNVIGIESCLIMDFGSRTIKRSASATREFVVIFQLRISRLLRFP
jgi:hypothetical protein